MVLTVLLRPERPVRSVDYGARMEALALEGLPESAVDGTAALDAAIALMRAAARTALDGAALRDGEAAETAIVWDAALPDELAPDRRIAEWAIEEHRERARSAIDDFVIAGGPALVHEAGAADVLAWGRWTSGGDAALVRLPYRRPNAVRRLAELQSVVLSERLRAGEHDEAARDLEALLGLGRLVAARPSLVEHLTGASLVELAVEPVRAVIDAGLPLDDPTLAAIGDVLARAACGTDAPPLPNAARALDGERMIVLDAIQLAYTDDGAGGGRLVPSQLASSDPTGAAPPPAPVLSDVVGVFAPGRRQVVAAVEAHFDALRDRAARPRCDRRADDPARPDPARADAMGILGVLLPTPPDATLDRAARSNALVAATALLVAIERHRLEHGAPPAALDELVPASLPHVPDDRYGCGPWGYRVDPDTVNGYVLWSNGADLDDDGGTPVPRRDPNGDGDLVVTPAGDAG